MPVEGAITVEMAHILQTAEYVSQLFPKLGKAQATLAATLYGDTGAAIDQVIGVIRELHFICHTYYLLRAFLGRSFKGEFAIPPGRHGQGTFYYFPSRNADGVPDFSNPQFDIAFPDAFTDFAMTLNLNIKHNPADVKPFWNIWVIGNTEMLFNKTESNQPVIHPITTSSALLKRCAFWESVGELTRQ